MCLTNIKEAKDTWKMSIFVVVCRLSGLSEDARLFRARGRSISALLERARAHCRHVEINHSKTNHILWFIWAPIWPRCSAATSRDQRLNQQPVRGIWVCWQQARAHREGPIMKPDPPFLQPTPQRLHWQTSHWTQLHMTHIWSFQIHFMTLLLRDTFLLWRYSQSNHTHVCKSPQEYISSVNVESFDHVASGEKYEICVCSLQSSVQITWAII